jgi:hypothetical protein
MGGGAAMYYLRKKKQIGSWKLILLWASAGTALERFLAYINIFSFAMLAVTLILTLIIKK